MERKNARRTAVLKIISLVVLVLVAIIVALPFLLDMDQFRSQCESKLGKALGREVKVGKIRVSLWTGSLAVNDISIADDPEYSRSPFLTAKSFRAGVQLKPLIFSKEVRITGISLEKPTIQLIRSATGKWNISNLGGGAGSGEADTGIMTSETMDSRMSIKKLEIIDGRVIRVEGDKKPIVYENVNLLVTDLSMSTSFPFEITASLPGGGNFKLQGQAGPIDRTDTLRTPVKSSIAVDDFDLLASGFVSQESGLSGVVDFSGTVSSDGRHMQSKGYANVENLQLMKGGMPSAKPVWLEYSLEYDLGRHSGRFSNIKIQTGKAAGFLRGGFVVGEKSPIVNMKLEGTGMPVRDLAALLPAFGVILPKGASLEEGSMNVDMSAQGPLDKLVTEGTVDIRNTRLEGFDLAGKLSLMAAVTGIGSSERTVIEKFTASLRLAPDGIRVHKMQMIMPNLGELSGTGKIEPDQTLDFAMQALLKAEGGVVGQLSRLTNEKVISVPFFVRGTASDPKFVPDTKNAVKSYLKSFVAGQEDNQSPSKSPTDAIRSLFKRR